MAPASGATEPAMKRSSEFKTKGSEPTPLGAIRPRSEGRMAVLLAAAQRWRDIAGPELAARLPLLDVDGENWTIGIPSPAWQAELERLIHHWHQQEPGRRQPVLTGKIMDGKRHMNTGSAPAQPGPELEPGRRLELLMEEMLKRRRS